MHLGVEVWSEESEKRSITKKSISIKILWYQDRNLFFFLTIWQFERDNEEPNRQTAAGTELLLSVVSTCASKKRIWNIVPPPNMTWFLCKSCVPFAPCSADRERHVERLHSINTYTVRAYQYPASNAQFSFNWYWCAVPRQRGYGIIIWFHCQHI